MSNTGLGDLTPAELQILMQILQGQQAPGVFGGDYGPSMDQAGLDLTGYNPVDIPQLTTKGKVDPYDLTQAQQRLNLEQDIYGSLNDPMLGALGGPGAFGPDAFQPTYDYGEPLNLVGRKKAQQYLDVGGYKGYIADAIMNRGMSPDEAAQSAIDLATNTDASKEPDPKQRALIESLQKTLPESTATGNNALGLPSGGGKGDLPGGRKRTLGTYDFIGVNKFATDLFEGIASDPSFAYQDEAGNFYAKTPEQAMQKTEQMKAFDKAGLPYMTDQYTDPGYVDKAIAGATGRNTEEQTQALQGYSDQMAQMLAEQQASNKRQLDARTAMDRLRQAPPPAQRPPISAADLYRNPNKPAPAPYGGMIMPNPIDAQGQRDLDAAKAAMAKAATPVTKRWGSPEPSTQPLFYVDADGNIVEPLNVAGGVRSLHDTAQARGLTRKPAGAPGVDMASLQAQYDRENQANTDFYKQQGQMLARDPLNDRIRAVARAQALAQAGRTPTRDALMQRMLAQRAMGFGQ